MPNLFRKGKRKNRVSDVLIFLTARNLRPKAEEFRDGSNCASSIGSGMPLNDIQTQMRATRSMRGCTR